MQTYTHFLLTTVLNQGLRNRRVSVHPKAFLLGAVMPDVPLFVLSVGYMLNRYRCGQTAAEAPVCGPQYDDLYFHNPWWLAGHNLWHAPFNIILMLAVGYFFGVRRHKNWGVALLWFAAACGLHTVVDIFTHHNDGPLLLFPFNWQIRFPSPVSYWDPDYGGRIMAPLEHLLDAVIMGYFIVKRLRHHLKGENYD